MMQSYKLIRSNRKTVLIRITREACVEVRAPYYLPLSEIEQFVSSKNEWIQKSLIEVKARAEERAKSNAGFSLTYGDKVSLQGKEYEILSVVTNRMSLNEKFIFMPENLSSGEIKAALIQLFKMAAKNIIKNKVEKYAACMNVFPANIRITGAKTRWGSCSGKNNINFTWKLILGNDEVIDYVVVHELAHIIEHNHSAEFWAVVSGILPDYKIRQEELKTLQQRLNNEGWE